MRRKQLAERIAGVVGGLPAVEHAVAYGSAVLTNASFADSSAALDVLVAVSDPVKWHEENMRVNPSHYALQMRMCGAAGVDGLARTVGAATHFNARLADASGRAFKYGVVSVDDCVKDLEVWNHLFVAGRLHKPHETVRACDAVTRAQARNARSAANAALLTLPESFTELEFHRAIVRLSYDGDVRFLFAAEDESKVERIARSNGEGLREAYEDVVRELLDASVVNVRSTGAWSQDVSPETLRGRVNTLPDTVMAMLRNVRGLDASADAAAVAESVCASVGDDPERVGGAVRACVRQIVRASTLRQAVAGLLSTSPLKTIAYVGAKFVKSAQSRTSG